MPDKQQLESLLVELIAEPHEHEWLEFKQNNTDKQEIGEYISALSNAGALDGKHAAYLVWGVKDKTHEITGTSFDPENEKIGNQSLVMWLMQKVKPKIDFSFHKIEAEGKDVVLLIIKPCIYQPVSFDDIEYIRIGSHKTKLKEHPAKERKLWELSSTVCFEDGIAKEKVSGAEVLKMLHYQKYFELIQQTRVPDIDGILERFISEKFLVLRSEDSYDITNLGALLFARDLSAFGPSLSRKAFRVILYKGKNRIETVKEITGQRGYAAGFEGLIDYINDLLPSNELIGKALRSTQRMYPELAIRELVANAIIHQNLSEKGTGPMVEIFEGRVEITNPGTPLIDPLRFIDEPPQSRNEVMAGLMRRLNICEERGSGIDKVIFEIEMFQLPAPYFRVSENHTIAVLFALKNLSAMSKDDKIRACYQHACLCYVSSEEMTNTSLRKRFGIADQNYATASRIIADTAAAKLIRQADETNTSKKNSKYVPFWG